MARPPRIKNFDYTGLHRYFLTICTRDRYPHFREADVTREAWSQILQTAVKHDMEITTYCFMPDHAHILATGTALHTDARSFVKLAKQQAGFWFRKARREHLWQEGFYDHVLREEDATPNVIRYIVNNPVRAGLVESPQQYEFWGSQVTSREELLDFIQGIAEWVPPWRRRRV
jgi:REP element-mobilizing transposase RayT